MTEHDDDLQLRETVHQAYKGITPRPGFHERAMAGMRAAERRRPWVPQWATGLAAALALALVLGVAVGHGRPGAPKAAPAAVLPTPLVTPSGEPALAPTPEAAPSATTQPTPDATPTVRPTPARALAPPVPPEIEARVDPAMATDQSTGRVFLYGGHTLSQGAPGAYLTDTWTWDGHRWTRLDQATTPQLYNAVLVWDAATSQLLLVGATVDSSGVVSKGGTADTFVWTGRSWKQVGSGSQPVNFFGASAVYDGGGRRLLLWVGGVEPGTYNVANRLYAWDGDKWSLVYSGTNSTLKAEPHTLVPSADGGFVGLGAKNSAPPQPPGSVADGAFYRFTGSAWQEEDVPGTPATIAEVAWDQARNRLVVLGSHETPIPDVGPNQEEIFVFDGQSWSMAALPQQLQHREGAGTTFDPVTDDVLLFGGYTAGGTVSGPPVVPLGDTWGWNGTSWRRLAG
jgi:hypothetical protein